MTTNLKSGVRIVPLINKISVRKEELMKIQKVRGHQRPSSETILSLQSGGIDCLCTCGKNTFIDKVMIGELLKGIDKHDKDAILLEGVLTKDLKAGEIVFVMDNTNSHIYPLACPLIFAGGNKECLGLYILQGNLKLGNNLPVNRLYRLTKIHSDLIPDNDLIKDIIKKSDIEILDKPAKLPVERKSSRSTKTKLL